MVKCSCAPTLSEGSGALTAGSRGQPPAPFPLLATELPADSCHLTPSCQVVGSPAPTFYNSRVNTRFLWHNCKETGRKKQQTQLQQALSGSWAQPCFRATFSEHKPPTQIHLVCPTKTDSSAGQWCKLYLLKQNKTKFLLSGGRQVDL